jgi:transposase
MYMYMYKLHHVYRDVYRLAAIRDIQVTCDHSNKIKANLYNKTVKRKILKTKKKKTYKGKMPPLSMERRTELVNRVTGGQPISGAEGIAKTMKISTRTIYRLLKQFKQPDGSYEAVPATVARKVSFSRENLIAISQWLQNEPKITLQEIRERLVSERIYPSIELVPHASTLFRQMKQMGFSYRRPEFRDPNQKKTSIQHERCVFRMKQDSGELDPLKLLSIDESNLHVLPQPNRAWGTSAKAPVLEKHKGKTLRNVMIATVGLQILGGEKKPIIHWTLIHPRESFRPLADNIEEVEIKAGEADEIRKVLPDHHLIKTMNSEQLKAKMKALGIRSESNTLPSMRGTLSRVMKQKTRLGELRARGRGRPSLGGQIIPATVDTRLLSEYIHSSLLPFLKTGKLMNPDGHECMYSADMGISGCSDGGLIEGPINSSSLHQMSILWDSAKPHLPSQAPTHVSAFHKYIKALGIGGGVKFTPPLSPTYNVVELFFSYVLRYLRKHSPPDTKSIVERIREVVSKITGEMVSGWMRKCARRARTKRASCRSV